VRYVFSREIDLSETLKSYRKVALEDIKGLMGEFIDGK
jgi:hypothetical protein